MKIHNTGIHLRSLRDIPCSRVILALATVQVTAGIILDIHWIASGDFSWLQKYFDYQGAIYFIFLDVFKLWLCVIVWKQFREKESLRLAWGVIALAMAVQLAGDLLKHWLCVDTYINPLHYLGASWNPVRANLLHVWGSAIAGPLFMLILAVGLFQGLQHYKHIHMLGRLRLSDLIWVAGVGIYALYVIATVAQVAISNPSAIHAGWVLTWPNDLLLAILLFEAILLMRTVMDMGQGYVALAWGAFAVAIFLTSLESLAEWMWDYSHISLPEYSVMWYVWFLWAAAFALGPAYQIDAIRIAESRVEEASSRLSNPSVAHASPCG